MYSFEPNEEQKMLVDVVERFSKDVLRSAAHEAEEANGFDQKIINDGWELGILQASLPEEFGGFGERSVLTNVLAAEKLAYGDMAGALAIGTPGLFAVPIMEQGSDAQKTKYLPLIAEEPWSAYTAAVIENDFDFDLNDMRTIAKKVDGGYSISGEKAYVPFAREAEEMLVFANFDDQTQGFIVEPELEGFEIISEEKTLGIQALPMYRIKFDNVVVSVDDRLGGNEGHDFSKLDNLFNIGAAILAVGVAQASLDFAVNYAKEREVFGVKVAQKQAIAFMIAEMDAQIEATRLLAWEAAWKYDNNKDDVSKSAYLAYSSAIDTAMFVTDRGVQILGGHGYIREFPVELWYRNGRTVSMLAGLTIL